MISRMAGNSVLALAAALFAAVVLVGPEKVNEQVVMRLVTFPETTPPPVSQSTAITHETVDSLITGASMQTHLAALTAHASRAVGYPGNHAAMRYIRDAFESAGLERVRVDTFQVASPIDHGFTLTIHDSVETQIPVYQLWPNLIRLHSFPDGLTGPMLYGGKGEFGAFNGREVEGGVVLLDFDGRDQFLNPFMLGARAVIFYNNAPGALSNNQASRKILDVPADVPRFYVDDAQAQALLERARAGGVRVTIRGRMTWENADTWNIMGWLPGSDEPIPGSTGATPERWKDRILVLSAFYDAMSVVPALAPGAEAAGSMAGFLEVMRTLTRHRPRYTVLFLATSGHFSGLQGVNAFLDRHYRGNTFFLDRIPEQERIPFSLFMGMDLSSQMDQVGLFCYGSITNFGPQIKNLFAPYAKRYIKYARDAGLYEEDESQSPYVNTLLPSTRTQFSYMPAFQAFDSEIVTLAGLHGLSFSTVNDNRVLVDTPLDRVEQVRIGNLIRQTRTVARLLAAMLSDPAAFVVDESIRLRDDGREVAGRILEFDRTVDFFRPNTPVSNAIAVYESGFQSHAGVRGFMTTLADSAGYFRFSMIRDPLRPVELRSYGLNENGEIVYAPDLGEEGDKTFPLDVPNAQNVNNTIQVLFPCRPLNFFDIVDPGAFVALDNLTVLGQDNSPLRKYGAAFVENQSLFGNWMTNAAVVFARPEDRPKIFMSTGPLGLKYLLTNTPEQWLTSPPEQVDEDLLEEARGTGFSSAEQSTVRYPFFQSALDLWNLNGARLENLRRHGVVSMRAATLHERSTEALHEALLARENRQYDRFVASSREAWGFEARAYPDVRYAADDTVDGIVFYFMLLLPFCFFMERLFFGSPDIRRQLATAGVIFIFVFLLLHRVHPAFQLSLTPYIVLLAFIILALGVVIISLLVVRFDSEMKRMTRATAGLHEADIGRLSATAVAISLGISNLRKRKLRTGLTAVTLTLLTFTVLSFTSFKTGIQFYTLDRDNAPPYQGAMLRSLSWNSLPTSFLPYIENAFGDRATVVPRSWYQPEDLESPYIDVRLPDRGVSSTLQILLGLHADEPKITGVDRFLLPGGRWFMPEERMACLVPNELAERLNITPEEVGTAVIELLGTRYTVVGLLDSKQLDAFRDMDNESLMPASFSMTQQVSQTAEEEFFMSTMKAAEHIQSRNVLILPYQQALDLSGSTRSVAVAGFADQQVLKETVERFMSRVLLAMFVGMGDEVKVYSSIGATSVSGLGNLIIPILIAAFLVLNTMMGAVYERFREIGVYSAVGLAPNHVAALFMAEAAAFAVIGAVMGYLVGQLLTMFLSSYDLLDGLSLNYSSLSAIYSTLVVMLVVFLSTLYPARKAADMTVEDVTRRWEPPLPEGDEWRFEFPFTLTTSEALGLSAYLTHIFRAHEDSSAEQFVAEGTRLSRYRGAGMEGYVMESTVWLAPYDLAISQDARITVEPVPEEKIYRILIGLRRRSGDWNQWQTINRRFFSALRKRFLVWRTLHQNIKEEYHSVGTESVAESVSGQPVAM